MKIGRINIRLQMSLILFGSDSTSFFKKNSKFLASDSMYILESTCVVCNVSALYVSFYVLQDVSEKNKFRHFSAFLF